MIQRNTTFPFCLKFALRSKYDIDELTLSFTSDIEGEFCTPILENTEEAYCEASLALGTHSLEFSAENPNQLTQSTSFILSILPSNQIDNDGDGFTEEEGDCNDGDPLISPNGTEIINNIDDDCNELIDDGTDIYVHDGDGFSENDGDCNDESSLIYPGHAEECNG